MNTLSLNTLSRSMNTLSQSMNQWIVWDSQWILLTRQWILLADQWKLSAINEYSQPFSLSMNTFNHSWMLSASSWILSVKVKPHLHSDYTFFLFNEFVTCAQEKVSLSVLSPLNRPTLRSVFELGQPNEELDADTLELVDHAIRPGHLALLHGFEVPGKWYLSS